VRGCKVEGTRSQNTEFKIEVEAARTKELFLFFGKEENEQSRGEMKNYATPLLSGERHSESNCVVRDERTRMV
jgi:hypothetical protein